MAKYNELPIPDAAKKDRQAFELVRVWVANKGQHVSLRAGAWDDPAFYGIMLADLAGHIANAYEQDAGLDRLKTLQRIKASLVKLGPIIDLEIVREPQGPKTKGGLN